MPAEKNQMIMLCRSMRDSRAEWFHTFASVRGNGLSTYGPTGLVDKHKPEARACGHHNAVLSDSSFVFDGKRRAPVNHKSWLFERINGSDGLSSPWSGRRGVTAAR
jgi:hypothetical protein